MLSKREQIELTEKMIQYRLESQRCRRGSEQYRLEAEYWQKKIDEYKREQCEKQVVKPTEKKILTLQHGDFHGFYNPNDSPKKNQNYNSEETSNKKLCPT